MTRASLPTKDQAVEAQVRAYYALDFSISLIVRLTTDRESDPSEPIRLLTVSQATPPAGIMPVYFRRDDRTPYGLVVVEVTPGEYDRIVAGTLALPAGWRLGESYRWDVGGGHPRRG